MPQITPYQHQDAYVMPTQVEDKPAMGIVWSGYIFAILMPIIGLILGIIVATRPAKAVSKHGWRVIVLSALAFVVYFALIMASISHSVDAYNACVQGSQTLSQMSGC